MERFSDAASAYEHATALNGNDAGIWADYAEAMALSNGQRLAGKPTEAISRALQIDPKNQKALALAGSAAFEGGDYQKAIDYWQKLLPLLPPGSDIAQTVTDEIAKAKKLAGDKGSK
jgi:cytochrome c-type biogenesis protein CcmH